MWSPGLRVCLRKADAGLTAKSETRGRKRGWRSRESCGGGNGREGAMGGDGGSDGGRSARPGTIREKPVKQESGQWSVFSKPLLRAHRCRGRSI